MKGEDGGRQQQIATGRDFYQQTFASNKGRTTRDTWNNPVQSGWPKNRIGIEVPKNLTLIFLSPKSQRTENCHFWKNAKT